MSQSVNFPGSDVQRCSVSQSAAGDGAGNGETAIASQPELDRQLSQLVAAACQHPPGSLNRRRCLSKLILAIETSGKLRQENVPFYEDALQLTWIYLSQNLCEACTAREPYDPAKSRVTTWLNAYLKRRLQDLRAEARSQPLQPPSASPDDGFDFLDNLEASPDIPPILEETRRWAERDPTGELQQIHIQGRPDLTCQLLILRRLPPETRWKDLATEFNCAFSTLANFYQKHCLPRMRQFGELQGYL